MPLTFAVGFAISFMITVEGGAPRAWYRENQGALALTELGIFAVCGVVALILTYANARPVRREVDETFSLSDDDTDYERRSENDQW